MLSLCFQCHGFRSSMAANSWGDLIVSKLPRWKATLRGYLVQSHGKQTTRVKSPEVSVRLFPGVSISFAAQTCNEPTGYGSSLQVVPNRFWHRPAKADRPEPSNGGPTFPTSRCHERYGKHEQDRPLLVLFLLLKSSSPPLSLYCYTTFPPR